MRAMLIVSANDAARMLALDIAGGEAQFAELMNEQAANLGLTNTHAVNATGPRRRRRSSRRRTT